MDYQISDIDREVIEMLESEENWSTQVVDETPYRHPAVIMAAAWYMLQEMIQNKLVVVLVPSPDPSHERKQRQAVLSNPTWYSELCQEYPREGCKKKKVRTIIKRRGTMTALERISERGFFSTTYELRLEPYVIKYAIDACAGSDPLEWALMCEEVAF